MINENGILFSRYYGVVTLIPIFQYSNVYATTPKLKELAEDQNLQERCIEYASKSCRLKFFYRLLSHIEKNIFTDLHCSFLNNYLLQQDNRPIYVTFTEPTQV